MSLPQETRQELCELLGALRDGQIDSKGIERLDCLVARDSSARRLYLDYVNLCASLHWTRSHHGSVSPSFTHLQATDSQCDSGGDDSRAATPVPDRQDNVAPSAPLATSTPSDLCSRPTPHLPLLGSFSYFSSGWPVAYLIATVIFAIGLVIGAITHVSPPGPTADPSSVADSNRQSPIPNPSSIVGRITGMVDCEWDGAGFRVRGSETANQKSEIRNQKSAIHLGDRLALKSGLLEITYDTGARVILQGPVTYEVESPAGGYLSVGKLTARLEQKSEVRGQKSEVRGQRSEVGGQRSEVGDHLFTVRTPTAIVTDLGTEFGVEVSKNGKTTSHVFRGSVAVRIVPAEGASADRELVLHENEAACIGRDAGNDNKSCTISRTKVEPSRFTRALPESNAQESPASDAYAEYVLSLKPAVYYRMEPPQKSDDLWTLYDFAGGGHHGTLHCDKAFLPPPYLAGRYGKSLLFRGPAVMDYAIVPDYPKATGGQLTVSAWVKMTTHPLYWALIASNWGDVQYAGQFHFGLYRVDGDLAANVTQPDGRNVLVREGELHPLPMGVWQHVALVADGSMLRLYRNGVNVASTLCTGIKAQTPVAALGIGCKTNDAGADAATDNRPAYWAGRIDELAIFNRALSTEEIESLCKGGNARE